MNYEEQYNEQHTTKKVRFNNIFNNNSNNDIDSEDEYYECINNKSKLDFNCYTIKKNLFSKKKCLHTDIFESLKCKINCVKDDIYELQYEIKTTLNFELNVLNFKRIYNNGINDIVIVENDNYEIKIVLPDVFKNVKLSDFIDYNSKNKIFKLTINCKIDYPQLISNCCKLSSINSKYKLQFNFVDNLKKLKIISITQNEDSLFIDYFDENNELIIYQMTIILPQAIETSFIETKTIIKQNYLVLYFDK